MTAPSSVPVTGAFQRDGYLGRVRLFDAVECRRIAAYLAPTDLPAPEWAKGRAASEPFLADVATRPELHRRLKPKLFAEFPPGARVVSHDFDMGKDWPPDRSIKLGSDGIYMWVMPPLAERPLTRQ